MSNEYVTALVSACPCIRQVWLMGSRANGTARPNSDWDYLIFGDDTILNALRTDRKLHRPDVDLLVVYDADNFVEPWGTEEREKRGSLSGWQWHYLSEHEAEYRATKPGWKITRSKAYRYWPPPA
jgi:hypothetical protein